MIAQQLVYREGGSMTVMAETVEQCRARTTIVSGHLKGSLLAVTVPYEVKRSEVGSASMRMPVGQTMVRFDVSIPEAFYEGLGEAFMKTYKQE
jgi:hypothetical protein